MRLVIPLKVFAGCHETPEVLRVGILVLRRYAILALTGIESVRILVQLVHLMLIVVAVRRKFALVDDNGAEKALIIKCATRCCASTLSVE